MPNNTRPFFIIAVYIPPKMLAKNYHECFELISEAILKIKTECKDPYIVIGGDLNRRDIAEAIGDYPDIQILDSPATRNDTRLDVAAASFHSEVLSAESYPPLITTEDLSLIHI